MARIWTNDLKRYKKLPGFKEFVLEVEGFETIPMRRVFAVYDSVDNAVYARLSGMIFVKIKPGGIAYSMEDSYRHEIKYVMDWKYMMLLRETPGFRGLWSEDKLECKVAVIGDDTGFMTQPRPFYVAFDNEINAVLYKLTV